MKFKKVMALSLMVGALAGLASCGNKAEENTSNQDGITDNVGSSDNTSQNEVKVPKYVFLFIGDGMSYPQIQSASYYLGANNSNIDNGNKTNGTELKGGTDLSFMNFEASGTAQTYDASSFAPDSASTATSIATGNKTWSGSINVSTDFQTEYKTIAESLKEEKDYKIGVVTSVNLNHATPAAFYAHQASRNSYYEIGEEMIDSGFDYFAGGALLKPNGNDNSKTNLYDLAEEKGYNVVKTQEEASKLTSQSGKSIVIGETLADSGSLSYELDRNTDEWALADYVEKGIDVLNNENGFFMMVEGGKIDWACHANDARSTIADTIALSNAVDEAVEFYNNHKDETLILVTGDHETGGLTIGYAGTDYATYMTNLKNQKISFAKYDSDYVSTYKKNNTSFEDILVDIKDLFGLVPNTTTDSRKELILTDVEYKKLEEAYNKTMSISTSNLSQEENKILYGSYEPLTVTICHILNNKSGISFSSYAHTGLPVAVFAEGVGASNFNGYYDNTDIYKKLKSLIEF